MAIGDQPSGEFLNRLGGLKKPILFSHRKPDGDALGAMVGLQQLLIGLGASPQPFIYEPLSPRYLSFPEFANVPAWKNGDAVPAECDGIIIVDTCAWSQLEPIEKLLREATVPRLVIDHHQTRDDLADDYWIDTSAAATCLMLFELARRQGWKIDSAAANALFIGIATDTGWFRHSNTDARVHHSAAELHTLGVEAEVLFDRLYLQDGAPRVRLLGEALRSLELSVGDRLALTELDADAFARSGATPADTEDMVNEPLRIAGVIVSVLLVQQPDGVIRANFRSKPPQPGLIPDIDVAAVAKHFGGGGHRRAAGARFAIPMNEAKAAVLNYLTPLLSA